MIVAIHQPNYLAWLGYFAKMLDSDVFILLDTVQFSKNSYQNRVRIKGPQGPQWLTQPVAHSGRSFQETRFVEFADCRWMTQHAKTLQANYARAPYFATYFDDYVAILDENNRSLVDCNERLIRWICDAIGATARIVRASDLLTRKFTDPTERLVNLVQAVRGDAYLAGIGGLGYQNAESFRAAKIDIVPAKSTFPEYPQLWGPYVPGLSILDLLMNRGPETGYCLRHGNSDEQS